MDFQDFHWHFIWLRLHHVDNLFEDYVDCLVDNHPPLFSKQHTNMWMQKQTHSCIEEKYKIHKSIMFQLSVTKIKWALINLLLTWQSLLLYKTIIILRQYPIKSNYHPMISLSIIEQIMSIYYSTELNEEIITCIAACSDPVCRKND